MPRYSYRCANQHVTERWSSIRDHESAISCEECNLVAQQMIDAPLHVSAQREVRYDSPITGEPITSRQAWKEDMKRHDCVEYDPCMKQEQVRRKEQAWKDLDQAVDASVAESVAKMSTKQRGELWSAVTEQGAGCDVVRSTPQAG